jgi:lactoylglutathione lyase
VYPASAFPSATNRPGRATNQTVGGRHDCYSLPMDTVRIEHVALWTDDLDRLASFYARYFDGRIGDAYRNDAKGFESRFVEFDEAGARLELMRSTRLRPLVLASGVQRMGFAHLALVVGKEADVDALTARLRSDGYEVLDGPRRTGDGYYESVVLDPDGNRLELAAAR